MRTLVTPASCRRLADAVTQLGGTLPTELQTTLDGFDALTAWQPAAPVNDVATAIAKGKFTATTASALLDKALNGPSVDAREIRVAAQTALANQFHKAVNGPAGDQLFESIRPTFDTAAAGILAAAEWINPASTAEQVLDMPDAAAAAWRDLPTHRRILDGIWSLLDQLADDFDVIGAPRPWLNHGSVHKIAFLVANENVNLDHAAMQVGPRTNSGRGGYWLALLTKTALVLNTPSRAREILAHAEERQRDQARADYAATHPDLVAVSD